MSKPKEAKQAKKEKVTHDFTKMVNEAIAKHGSPLLKHLNKTEPFVRYFHYRPGRGFCKTGEVFVNGRSISAYAKGIMYVTGEVTELFSDLPTDLRQEVTASVMDSILEATKDGRSTNQVLIQGFNTRVQNDINTAMKAAGHDEFAFVQEYTNSAGRDTRVFVRVVYDGHMIEDERIAEIEAANAKKKDMRIMAEARGRDVVDARSGSAEYSNLR